MYPPQVKTSTLSYLNSSMYGRQRTSGLFPLRPVGSPVGKISFAARRFFFASMQHPYLCSVLITHSKSMRKQPLPVHDKKSLPKQCRDNHSRKAPFSVAQEYHLLWGRVPNPCPHLSRAYEASI